MFWGKTKLIEGVRRDHPLADHCLDVAAVFKALAPLRLGNLTPSQIDRLAVTAFLHDLGKCNWGFQAKADPQPRATTGHVVEAVALLQAPAVRSRWPTSFHELLTRMCHWFIGGEEQMFEMLMASISHHGRPVSWREDYSVAGGQDLARWWLPHQGLDPMAGVAELAQTAGRTFPRAFAGDVPPIEATPAFQRRFSGLVMLADWIGSDTQFFPYRQSPREDRSAFAADKAWGALSAIGLRVPDVRVLRPFHIAFGFAPNALQRLLAEELPVDEANRVLLAESDTGSGKTEAALAWFFRLYASGRVDGLYFALPTRVAAREMYDRVRRAIERAFPDSAIRPGPVLLAVPGYVRADGIRVLTDPNGTVWDDDARSARRERLWAAERPKRFLAAPVVVGTVDQALLSVLQVKHALMRSVCLDRHLLVVDELHASDTYVRELLRALLRRHMAGGGWSLMLSATLGESARAAFFGRDPLPFADTVRRPYPSLTMRSDEQSVQAVPRTRTVGIEWLETLEDADLLPQLAAAVDNGARVLVICNTVGRANALLRAVESDGHIPAHALFALGGVVCPHHGRFAREDREMSDAAVTRRLGKNSSDRPLLLIGTQTLEQSLDIDADWLVTDLAPIDVLLQRIGRLHRHDRACRPAAFCTPRALIRVPDQSLSGYLRQDGSLKGPAGLGAVYVDGRILACTLQELRAHRTIVLPDDARALVEAATHPDSWNRLDSVWKPHADHIEGRELMALRAAVTNAMDERVPFGEWHWPHDGARIATRLGADSLELPLSEPARSPFGALVRRVPIPAHLAPSLERVPEALEARALDGGFEFALGQRTYRYSRFGLEVTNA